MSRRCHHGSARHGRSLRELGRPDTDVERRPRIADAPALEARLTIAQAAPAPDLFGRPMPQEPMSLRSDPPGAPIRAEWPVPDLAPPVAPQPPGAPQPAGEPAPATDVGIANLRRASIEPRPAMAPRPPIPVAAPAGDAQIDHGATGPQLRRFIKSRAYVPMHELRRRFAINGHDDEVSPVDLEHRRVFVGLPDREGRLLAELLRGGDIGYELSMDPITPIVVGVYPMRPVTRP
jgi:hypothetical protein